MSLFPSISVPRARLFPWQSLEVHIHMTLRAYLASGKKNPFYQRKG